MELQSESKKTVDDWLNEINYAHLNKGNYTPTPLH